MAYSLNLNGGAIQIPKITFTGDFSVTLKATQQANGRFFCGGDNTAGSIEIYRNNSGIVALYIGTVGQFSGTTALSANVDAPDTIVVARAGSSVTVRVNGILQGTATFSGNMHISWFGLRQGWGNYPATMRFYSCNMQDLASPSNGRNYDPSLTGGTGVLLPTTAGTNAGTQFGSFPTDNSEWVFYASSASYSDTLQGIATTSSIGQIISTVSRASVLNGISATSAVGSVQSTVARNSTLNGISSTMQVGGITSSVNRNSLLQGVSSTSAIGSIESTISRGAVSYSSELQGVSISSSIGAIQSSITRNSVLSGISSESQIGNITSQVARNSILQGITTTSFIGNITAEIVGAVTVSIDGYTISFAKDQHTIKFDQDHISAGFEKDLVSISWRH